MAIIFKKRAKKAAHSGKPAKPYTPIINSNKAVVAMLEAKINDYLEGSVSKDKMVGYITGMSKFDKDTTNPRLKSEWTMFLNYVRTL